MSGMIKKKKTFFSWKTLVNKDGFGNKRSQFYINNTTDYWIMHVEKIVLFF